ncbi:hypothetical protein Pmani_014741 [Petrolisthes manimaculis]|uniref:Uncharacterized protein n=1 Tax=Petrolisthes manimaculis TaxID=1843537 RepID=A0AAE1PTN7_9EUCA|nr:hypothetical protein Pmani_014741 [Petrolisthes manimaculis]
MVRTGRGVWVHLGRPYLLVFPAPSSPVLHPDHCSTTQPTPYVPTPPPHCLPSSTRRPWVRDVAGGFAWMKDVGMKARDVVVSGE